MIILYRHHNLLILLLLFLNMTLGKRGITNRSLVQQRSLKDELGVDAAECCHSLDSHRFGFINLGDPVTCFNPLLISAWGKGWPSHLAVILSGH